MFLFWIWKGHELEVSEGFCVYKSIHIVVSVLRWSQKRKLNMRLVVKTIQIEIFIIKLLYNKYIRYNRSVFVPMKYSQCCSSSQQRWTFDQGKTLLFSAEETMTTLH